MKIKRLASGHSILLPKNGFSSSRPLKARLASGLVFGLALPAIVAVLVAAYDPSMLITYLQDESNSPAYTVRMLIFLGAFIGFSFWVPKGSLPSTNSTERESRKEPITEEQGRHLAVSEAKEFDLAPSEDCKVAMQRLSSLLFLLEPERSSSEILDHRILKAMGFSGSKLEPTRRLKDALELATFRFSGVKSTHQWRVRHSTNHRLSVACLECRESEEKAWKPCISAYAPTVNSAIIIAIFMRESMVFYRE